MTQTLPEDAIANPPETGTETTENPTKGESETPVDYKVKFSESSKEAMRLLEEKKAKDAEIERLKEELEAKQDSGGTHTDNPESLYPGFETLSQDEQANLIAYTDNIKRKALEEIHKDPALTFAKESYNERQWDKAFEAAATDYPELRESKDDFKSKYYKANNVPNNIGDILKDLSKVYLFDRARDLGAKDAEEKASRIEIERAAGGDKNPKAGRSIEDWHQLAQNNPKEFSKLTKEYESDLASGKL